MYKKQFANRFGLTFAIIFLAFIKSFASEKTAQEIFESEADSIVKITALNPFNIVIRTGSGVLLGPSKSRYPSFVTPERDGFFLSNKNGDDIISNLHVIAFASKIIIETKSGKKCEAGIVYFDSEKDIAVLRTASRISDREINISNDLKVGQKVFAIGNPSGLNWSISDGIISGIRTNAECELIQFTAPISGGSSGGGLFGSDGNLVGITTSQIKDAQNINFAIKISKNDDPSINFIREGYLIQPDKLEYEDWAIGYWYAEEPVQNKKLSRFLNKNFIEWSKFESAINTLFSVSDNEVRSGRKGYMTGSEYHSIYLDATEFLRYNRSLKFQYDICGRFFFRWDRRSKSVHNNFVNEINEIYQKNRGVLLFESEYIEFKSELSWAEPEEELLNEQIVGLLKKLPDNSSGEMRNISPYSLYQINKFYKSLLWVSEVHKFKEAIEIINKRGYK
jgi:hypothetical protein